MREVTFQIVMRLREADDKQVRFIEDALARCATGQLIFTDEMASAAKIMDREVEVIDEVEKHLDRYAPGAATKGGACPHCGRDVKRGASVRCPHAKS